MSKNPSSNADSGPRAKREQEEIEIAAAAWLARRERGFSVEEEGAFDAWLAGDARHGAAVAESAAMWGKLDRLRALRPAAGRAVDPDFFRRGQRTNLRFFPIALAAAAALAIGITVFWRVGKAPAVERVAAGAGERHLTLPDGSGVDFTGDSRVEVNFTPAERRVVLQRGEANFTVAKNPARPFLVSAHGVAVRAVGTVFAVRLQADGVEVSVTEGKVRVAPDGAAAASDADARFLVAGERLRVPTGGANVIAASSVARVGEEKRGVAWQGGELVFAGQPLAAVVEEFNRRSPRKLVIGDAELAAVRVGGKFRAENVDGFVRLLEDGFGISAERKDGEIVLRKAP